MSATRPPNQCTGSGFNARFYRQLSVACDTQVASFDDLRGSAGPAALCLQTATTS